MKKLTKAAMLAVLNLLLAGSVAHAQTGPDNDQPPGPPGAGPNGAPPPPVAALLAGLLDKYDVNKDGQLDQNELATLKRDIAEGKLPPPPMAGGFRRAGGLPGGPPPPLPREILDKYDVNHDGQLDESERAALHKDIQDGKIQLPAGAGLRAPGGPPPTAKEIIAKYDTDKDGKLDETELAAFLKDMHQRRRPPVGPGGPPPGGPAPDAPATAPQQ